MKRVVIALLFMLVATASAGPFKKSDRVVAQYAGGNDWYAGVVSGFKGKQVTVDYLDGSTETLPASRIRKFNWKVGTKVTCNLRQESNWYLGKITKLDGNNAHIKYENGAEEDTSIAHCRWNEKDQQ